MASFWATSYLSDWDVLILGSSTMPGRATVTTERSRSVEVQKEKRKDGARLVDNGYNPSTVTATLELWEKEHFDIFDRVYPRIDPRKSGGLKTPIDIVHPATRLLGIKTVYIASVSVPPPVDGVLRVQLNMVEWVDDPKSVRVRKVAQAADEAQPRAGSFGVGEVTQGNVQTSAFRSPSAAGNTPK